MLSDKLRFAYNEIAEDWHRDHKNDDWWREGTDYFVSTLKPGALVLDAGCGGGTKSRYLLDQGLSVVGVDISPRMIAIAKREVPSGEFFVGDISQPETLPAQKFSGVLLQAVLLHLEKSQVASALQNLLNVLLPGGAMYIAVKEQKPGQAEEEIVRGHDYGYPYERFFSYYELSEVTGHCNNLGMRISFEKVTPSGKTRWIQVVAHTI